MCSRKSSVAYFAHDRAHRLLPASGDGDADGEFTCDGCLVAGAGRRYRCNHPGCSFTIHESCARGFPRKLRSAVHPRHRLRRRETAAGCCEGCGEDVKGACGVAVHPLCAPLPGSARGPAHASGGHEAWLVRASSEDGGDGKQKKTNAAAACGRPVGAWRYRRVTCLEELHPRCLVPATDQCCRGTGAGEGKQESSLARSCCRGLMHDVTKCLATLGTALHYRGYYNG